MNDKKYKIKIAPDRILGPLDFDRVKALVMKGRIQGLEPTSAEPYTEWSSFLSFPELSEMLLKKMEKDEGISPKTPEPNQSNEAEGEADPPAATHTILSSERTKTMASSGVEFPPPEQQTGSFGIPTLLDIKKLPKDDNPDLERTIIGKTDGAPPPATIEREDATRILAPESVDLVLQQYTPPDPSKNALAELGEKKNIFGKKIDASAYVTETGKKRLLSRNTAALLALMVVLIGYWSTQQEEQSDPANILPRYHTFPYVEVNVPPRLGDTIDQNLSAELVEASVKMMAKENPSAYMIAIKKYLYKAVGKNITNYDAKALLATAYIRISEIVPRDQRLFETIDKLLLPSPPRDRWTPEYVVGLSEYYQMLNRHDQAQEIVDGFLKRRQTAELLYQRAKISFERRELDVALTFISKAIPPENVGKANPRHLLFYSMLLDQRGQKDAATQNMDRLLKETKKSGYYGPGLLFQADLLFRQGKFAEARKILKILLGRPYLLDRVQQADAFVVAAKVLEGLNDLKRAKVFADQAAQFHYDNEVILDLLFRIKSKIPSTKEAYSKIVQGRQKEKAKQFDQAISYYIGALELNRSDPTAYLLLASLFEERGEVNEAIDRYMKSVASNIKGRPVDSYLQLARIFANRFELEMANNNIKMASELKRKRDRVDYLRGLVFLKQKREDLAMPYLEKALAKGSRFTDLYIQLGDIEVAKKNQKLAEFYYSIALRYAPFHPKAMLGVALTRFHLDSPSRAVSFLKDKLATQPNSAAIMSNLAIIYLRSGDQDAGKNYLQNAIRSDSRYADAFRLLGDLTKDEGDRQTENYDARRHSYRYALASYEMYCKLAPNDPEGFRATGDLYFDIRDLGAAAKNYHKVLSLTKNYPGIRLKLAQISRNGGDAASAMKLLDEEIKINPRSDSALVEKGNVFMIQKDFSAATKAYTEAARLNEANADALYGLGVVYHLQGSYDNALSLFARVVKLDPLKADVYKQMGLIYQKQNNRSKAAQAFTNFKGLSRIPADIAYADEKLRELKK
jgi:tetratricopeptide (TPR) repeat protein